ncbi:MAG: rhomboid family intramembrane serine protease, partial [Phycisphaeraceae bacterium]
VFIPIRSDRPLRNTPYVNYALIAINVLVFGFTANAIADPEHWSRDLLLTKLGYNAFGQVVVVTELFQFITYQFLHASPMHLIGNMIFLWVFGNAVEDRLGKFGYLFFYLAMGVLAGIGHWLTSDAPVLGASGSVAGVSGAFLMLFPLTRITFFYWYLIFGTFEISAKWVIAFYVVKDIFFLGMDVGNTAYTAHLAGYVGGFTVALGLLATRILPREPYDLFTMWAHKRRRNAFRKITQQGYQAWEGKGHRMAKPEAELTPAEKEIQEQRQAISRSIANHDLDAAAMTYLRLVERHGQQTLSQRHQFDIANHLFSQGEHQPAATAYERLLDAYPKHPDRGQVQLMLGLINARYLDRHEQAKPLLQEASQRLHGDDAALARQLLSEIR